MYPGFDVAASRLWTNEYLIEKMGQRKISVAVTPNGYAGLNVNSIRCSQIAGRFADAVTSDSGGRRYFTEPCVEKMTMQELLSKLNQGDSGCCSIIFNVISVCRCLQGNGNRAKGSIICNHRMETFLHEAQVKAF